MRRRQHALSGHVEPLLGIALACLLLLPSIAKADSSQTGETPTPAPTATPSGTIQGAESVDPTTPTRDFTLVTAYTGSSYAPGDLRIWQLIPREEVLRVGKSLLRASLPRWQSIEGGASGWGDAQAFYLLARHFGKARYGAGVSMWFPVASNPMLGTGKWSIGPSFGVVVVDVKSKLLLGALTQSFFSFAGPSWRKNQSQILFQPIVVKGLGAGWSFRSVDANWSFDLERGATVIPLSLGFGKQMAIGTQKFNVAMADEVTVVHANAPRAPKNTMKLTISVLIPR